MTYYGGKELAAAFRTVRNNTIQIAEDIPESQYGFKPAPDTNSVAQTLAHIAVSTGFQSHIHENKVADMKTVNFMELVPESRPRRDIASEESGRMTRAEGAGLRAFRSLLFDLDPTQAWGGLRRKLTPSGDYVWVCERHYQLYDPGLPVLPA